MATTVRCTSAFISSMVSFTLLDRVAHLLHEVGDVERLLAGNRRVRGDGRGGVGPGADAEIAPADEPFGLDRRDRVGTHQLMQVLGDLELHPELLARRVRRKDLL